MSLHKIQNFQPVKTQLGPDEQNRWLYKIYCTCQIYQYGSINHEFRKYCLSLVSSYFILCAAVDLFGVPQRSPVTHRTRVVLLCRHWLKHMRRLLYFLKKCGPQYELCSHSCKLRLISSANELRPPPTGHLGFGNTGTFQFTGQLSQQRFMQTVLCFGQTASVKAPFTQTLQSDPLWSDQ